MDFYKLFGFFKILKESILLLPRNGKVVAIIAILSILLSYLIYFSLTLSVISLAQDMLDIQKSMIPDPSSFNASDPSSFTPALTPSQLADQLDRVQKILMLLCAVGIAFIIVFFIISFFITLATILVSAFSYTGNTLSIKEFFSRTASLRTWKGPFVTSISVAIHALGYFLAVGILIAPAIMYQNVITLLVAVFVAIAAFVFYLYLLVVWALAVVVSVAEENCYGMVAMGKAATLVKGQRLNGYMLNLFFALPGLIISFVFQVMSTFGPYSTVYGVSVVAVIFGCLVKILLVVAYTVLYFHCKNHHGEYTEIDGMVKYAIPPAHNSKPLNA